MIYLRKVFWTNDLSVFYPYTRFPQVGELILSILALGVITLLVVRNAVRRPYLAVGWFWFLGVLVPVIGVVQVGGQTMADRFTYVSLIGIFIALVWWADDLINVDIFRRMAWVAGAIAVISFAFCAHWEAGNWRNSITLFDEALAHTKNNFYILTGISSALDEAGMSKQADVYFHRAFLMSNE